MMDCLYVFLFMLHFSAGCDLVHNAQTRDVTGYSGESVVLPCSCTEPQTKPDQLKWMYYQGKHEEIYPSEHIKRYKNRVKLLNQNTPGNLSLLISSLTTEDEGNYQCYVETHKYIYIRLSVKGCDLVHNAQIREATGYSGESVVLPCSCTEPQAKPDQLKWTYYQGKHEEIYPSEHIERYKNRVTLLNQNTPGDLSLLISSLTTEDGGDYQCYVSTHKYIYFRLSVKERPHVHTIYPSTSQPSTTSKLTQQANDSLTHQHLHMHQNIVILVAVFASVLLLALLVFIHWRWKVGKNVKVTRDGPELVREPKDGEEVTYSAVVHVKRSSTPTSTQNDKVDDTEYASINVKRT